MAYTTGMDASVVIGQQDFTSGLANQGGSVSASTVKIPTGAIYDSSSGKLIIGDYGNNRVLIYNSIPTTNNASADVVIGQSSFSGSSANQGGSVSANTLYGPREVAMVGNRLLISDRNNHRVLIYNSIPTSNNASADVVIGQTNLSSGSVNQGGSRGANTLNAPFGIASDGQKLFISEENNHRILIFNSIPTANNASADVVVGQADFTGGSADQGGTVAANTLQNPSGIIVVNGKLIVGDNVNHRVLIFNQIPTTNNASADVVLGQVNFTTDNSAGTTGANNTRRPIDVASDGNRLFIVNNYTARVIIHNSIPTTNAVPHDISIGQINLTNNIPKLTVDGMQDPMSIALAGDKLIVTMDSQNRVLIYDNIIKKPGISVSNSPEGRDGGLIRLQGTARVDDPYTVQSVQYAVNGGGFTNATATDGSFNSTSEDFYFDFDPKSNSYDGDGYTVRIKSTNNNTDVTDNLFYFSPFNSDSPSNNAYTTNELPTFGFTINKGRFQDLRENVSKFKVMINKDNTGWQTYIDNIPVSYEAVKNSGDNRESPTDNNKGNGIYENQKIWVDYSNDNASIRVYSKGVDNDSNSTDKYFEDGGHKLSGGSYQWKVVSVDRQGHEQETETRYLRVNTNRIVASQTFFPLAVLNISGFGNPDMSTTNLTAMKASYAVNSEIPIFYGIANVGSAVSLEVTDTDCQTKGLTDCTKTYTTVTNPESRFGINVPDQSLTSGRSYSTRMFVSLGNDYNELPTFNLVVR